MDLKDFREGLLSLSMVLFIFSFTFMLGTIIMKPYLHVEPHERDFIVIMMIINFPFCLYYGTEAQKLLKTFSMEDKYVLKFAKRIGIINLIYSPHLFVTLSMLFMDYHELQAMMVGLIVIMEALLVGVVYKEVYDLLFLDESSVKFELDENRKRYLDRSKKPIEGWDY